MGPEGRTVSASSKHRSYSTRHCLLALLPGDTDGQMHMGRRRKERKELKSDVKKEILMKVERSSGEGEPGLRKS